MNTKHLAELAEDMDDAVKFGGSRKLFAECSTVIREHIAILAANEALSKELESVRADAERLAFIESKGFPGLGWVARDSTTGRGYRLHQDGASVSNIREAIDAARNAS